MKRILLIYILPSILILTVLLGFFISGQNWKKQALRFEEQTRITQGELSSLRSNQELLKQNSAQVRQYINLPALTFDDPSLEDESKDSELPEQGTFELAAYAAVAYLDEHNSGQDTLRNYSALLEDPSFLNLLKQLNLSYRKSVGYSGILSRGDDDYFTLEYLPKSDEFQAVSCLGEAQIKGVLLSDKLVEYLQSETTVMNDLYGRVGGLNQELMKIYQDRELRSSLNELQLYLGKPFTSAKMKSLPVLRIDDSLLISMRTDIVTSSYQLGDASFRTLDELKTGLLDYVNTNDIRTDAKIQDDSVEEEMTILLKDPAFLQRLKDLGFTPVLIPREDNDYIYYDLLNSQNKAKGSLALQKEFAEVYLMDGDDIPVRSLRAFTSEHNLTFNYQLASEDKEILSDQFIAAEGSETFLLIGSHEHNADTMILLHADSDSGEMRMLSIPRDLYYQGRKINSIYRQQGPEQLMSALSAVTGLDIRNYVGIDMYAFIDVVNILGGIDVTLDEALVDPTYKVRENGRWSTLYYTAGIHHLDGIAALRIARSRHTSSDFERSVRQQKVIASLKDSVSVLGLTNISKIYDIIQTSGKYVESNLSTADMVKYFLSYKDFEISGQHVMNTDNVLYATYTNLYRLSEEEQEKALEDPNYYKGGWIVLPKNNDWSIIKSYIRSVLTF